MRKTVIQNIKDKEGRGGNSLHMTVRLCSVSRMYIYHIIYLYDSRSIDRTGWYQLYHQQPSQLSRQSARLLTARSWVRDPREAYFLFVCIYGINFVRIIIVKSKKGASAWDRTKDLSVNSRSLCRLSHGSFLTCLLEKGIALRQRSKEKEQRGRVRK